MSEKLLRPAQVAVLDQSTMRTAQIGLLRRYNRVQTITSERRIGARALLSELLSDNEDFDLTEYDGIVEQGIGAMSFEAPVFFWAADAESDHKPHAVIHMIKVNSSTGEWIGSSDCFIGGITLPTTENQDGTRFRPDIFGFESSDVYFGLLRIQHQLDVGLNKSLVEPSDQLKSFVDTWPNLQPIT